MVFHLFEVGMGIMPVMGLSGLPSLLVPINTKKKPK